MIDARPIVVTGATGYVGGRLVARLLEAGHRVRCVARAPQKIEARSWARDPRVEIVRADLADRASSETDRAIELRARDRQRKLISKIDAALQRIDDNTSGYCEETGDPISLKRLEARPIATLSVEAQERHEKREKVYRDE